MKNKAYKNILLIFTALILFMTGVLAGFLFADKNSQGSSDKHYLRLEGYKYTNPLLICDLENDDSRELEGLRENVQVLINDYVNENKISRASVYYRQLNSGDAFTLGENERYYPASLNKIPIMMSIYKIARSDPSFLDKRVLWNDQNDYNSSQEIQPEKFAEYGKEYSVNEAMEMLIKYSDNNSFYLLTNNIDQNTFNNTFSDLNIPIRDDPESSPDFLTVKQFSYFLRVLYNATYLRREYSESALKLLSTVIYKEGLVGGVPSGIEVAHKYGFAKFEEGDRDRNELHDCGIVYDENPYLLCVMTENYTEVDQLESFIKKASELIYNHKHN